MIWDGTDVIIIKCTINVTVPPPSAAAAAKLLQSCPTLCDPIDGSPPGSPVPGILQARTLEWVAISFSSASKWKVKVKLHSCVGLFATPRTAAYQAPPSVGFSRQEYWSGVPLPSLPPHPQPMVKLSSMKPGPGAKKAKDHGWREFHRHPSLCSQAVKANNISWCCQMSPGGAAVPG